MIGMQPIHNQTIQYVPVMVSPPIGSPMGSPAGSPILTPMQPPTLMHEMQNRQQYGTQQRQRMSQYAPQVPQHVHPAQRFPQGIQSRPQSFYPNSRQSVYDQKSLYSLSSQQPTPRPKLPSTNPAYRLSSISSNNSQPGRYRASTYGNTRTTGACWRGTRCGRRGGCRCSRGSSSRASRPSMRWPARSWRKPRSSSADPLPGQPAVADAAQPDARFPGDGQGRPADRGRRRGNRRGALVHPGRRCGPRSTRASSASPRRP